MLRYIAGMIALLVTTMVTAQAPIAPKQIAAGLLPAGIKIKGTTTEAWRWNDKLGENILVLSVLGPYKVKIKGTDEEAKTIELFATHFYKKDSVYKIRWSITDHVKECPLDYEAEFIKEAVNISDVDKDGMAETIVQYKLACRGDVSPSFMKLIMHEDSVKYALRGSMWLDGAVDGSPFAVTESNVNLEKLPKSNDEMKEYIKSLGRYQSEKEFAKAPPQFLQLARRQWLKYVKESFE